MAGKRELESVEAVSGSHAGMGFDGLAVTGRWSSLHGVRVRALVCSGQWRRVPDRHSRQGMMLSAIFAKVGRSRTLGLPERQQSCIRPLSESPFPATRSAFVATPFPTV